MYQVSGTVTDSATGEELFGADVSIKGTTIGAVTNFFGYYRIPGNLQGRRLVFSYIGYKTVDTLVTRPNQEINIQMEEDLSEPLY